MSFAILAASALAVSAPVAADTVDPTLAQVGVESCDERVLALPGEAPLGTPCSATEPDTALPPPAEGEIVVTAREQIREDPLAQVNAQTYEVVSAVDEALVEPVALAYGEDLPKPIRKGLSNFFGNLREPVVFLNDVLQLRPKRAVKTLGRFVVNSTFGVGGLVDVAKKKPFRLPRRANGFANTLGYYGVGSGPFLVLPLVGATTVRDLVGGAADGMVLPTAVGKPFTQIEYRVPDLVVTSLDERLRIDGEIKRARAANDPYASMRDAYMARRAAEIAALKAPGNGIPKPGYKAEVPKP